MNKSRERRSGAQCTRPTRWREKSARSDRTATLSPTRLAKDAQKSIAACPCARRPARHRHCVCGAAPDPYEPSGECLPRCLRHGTVRRALASWLGSRASTASRGDSRTRPCSPWVQGLTEARQVELVVHGYLRSRAIPRSAIVEVTDSSSVIWTDAGGRKRRTPILAFSAQPGMLPTVAEHHAECRRQLQRWARGR